MYYVQCFEAKKQYKSRRNSWFRRLHGLLKAANVVAKDNLSACKRRQTATTPHAAGAHFTLNRTRKGTVKRCPVPALHIFTDMGTISLWHENHTNHAKTTNKIKKNRICEETARTISYYTSLWRCKPHTARALRPCSGRLCPSQSFRD